MARKVNYIKSKKNLTKEDCKSLIQKSNIEIGLQQETIKYWSGKSKSTLDNADLFIFLQSGFNTVEDYLIYCNNRIEYHKARIEDMEERLERIEKDGDNR